MLLAAFFHLIQFFGVWVFPKGISKTLLFWVRGYPKLGDTQNSGIPKTRGYPKHCNRASEGKLEREGDFMSHRKCDFTQKDHSFFPLMLQSHSKPTILQHKKDSTKAVADSKECLKNLVCIICYI